MPGADMSCGCVKGCLPAAGYHGDVTGTAQVFTQDGNLKQHIVNQDEGFLANDSRHKERVGGAGVVGSHNLAALRQAGVKKDVHFKHGCGKGVNDWRRCPIQ